MRSTGSSAVFVKTAADAGQAARLRREAELLAIAQGRGVVSLVAEEGTPAEPVLATGRVDGPDLSRVRELTVEEVAGLVAAVGATLAELHEAGVVHGAVMAEHVLLPPDGRPVLCGLGFGGRAGEPPLAEAPLPEPAVDPARFPGSPLSPMSDVLALGALLDGLLATATRADGDGAAVDALRAVAARTAVADPELRPSARAVVEAVRHAMPSARLPGPPGRSPSGRPADRIDPVADAGQALRASRRRGGAGGVRGRSRGAGLPGGRGLPRPGAVPVLAGTALVLAVAFLLVRVTADSPTRPESTAPRLPAPSTTPAVVPPADAAPPATTLPVPATACPAVAGLLAADVDGDGCPESLRWEGGVVEGGERRWSVGRPGDLAVAADWTCSGRATLAVLRPATGQVFVFDGWATSGHDVTAPEAARVEGAFAVRAAELDGDACADLVVERTAGAPATVPVPIGRR